MTVIAINRFFLFQTVEGSTKNNPKNVHLHNVVSRFRTGDTLGDDEQALVDHLKRFLSKFKRIKMTARPTSAFSLVNGVGAMISCGVVVVAAEVVVVVGVVTSTVVVVDGASGTVEVSTATVVDNVEVDPAK